jgi:peptidoglycan L-alanyl-D-glutamate endopeptidase CwlK
MAKDLESLVLSVKNKAIEITNICSDKGVDLLIYCTYRSLREQAMLFRQGRSKVDIDKKIVSLTKLGFKQLAELIDSVGPQNGKKVTNAGPGESWHNYGEAFDAVPCVGGKALWNDKEKYLIYGNAVKQVGMFWAGDWKTFKEYPHAQLRLQANPLKVLSPDEVSRWIK